MYIKNTIKIGSIYVPTFYVKEYIKNEIKKVKPALKALYK